jgi:hypothetical protein
MGQRTISGRTDSFIGRNLIEPDDQAGAMVPKNCLRIHAAQSTTDHWRDIVAKQPPDQHDSLKSPLCSCVSITLPLY